MFSLRIYAVSILSMGIMFFAITVSLPGQSRGPKIESKGMPAQINQSGGIFNIESLTVTTTPATKYEDRRDRHVDQSAFSADLHESGRVEAEGSLQGNTTTARKIEIEDYR
jgi:hypothetical protein